MKITPTPDASILDRHGHVVVMHAEPRHREYIATSDDGHTLQEHPGTVALGTLYLDPATGVAYRLTNYYSDGYGADKGPDVPHYSMLNVDGTQSRGTLPDTAAPAWSPVGPRGEHRDTHQTYEDGAFVTHCTCGHTTQGMDPDDADAKMLDHISPDVLTFTITEHTDDMSQRQGAPWYVTADRPDDSGDLTWGHFPTYAEAVAFVTAVLNRSN